MASCPSPAHCRDSRREIVNFFYGFVSDRRGREAWPPAARVWLTQEGGGAGSQDDRQRKIEADDRQQVGLAAEQGDKDGSAGEELRQDLSSF